MSGVRKGPLHALECEHPAVVAPFVGETSLSPLDYHGTLVENHSHLLSKY